jgi:two-component system, OmpR family, sensor histidine kinase MprB
MSLRRRIAIAAAVAVAAVAVAVAVIGYVSTRSHLIGNVKHDLARLAAPYIGPHPRQGAPPPGLPQGTGPDQGDFDRPPNQPFGGANGHFQVLHPDGHTTTLFGARGKLPVSSQMIAIARRARGRLFTNTHVDDVHLEMLTVGDPFDHWAVQVALPLTDVDSVLNGLLLPYGLLIGGGVLFAALLGIAISRSALRPIDRFLRQTETVSAELEHPQRLEETGPTELRRLAASFNRTLDALERSIESQRHLVADASHELRTPLAALRSNVQIFLDSERLPPEERAGLQQSILVELDELTQIVSDVVELARGSGPGESHEPLELDTLVREEIARARRRAPGLTFQLDLEPTVIDGSPDRIGRAVANMIDNARKWSPEDGEIEVTLHDGTLTVRDHGPGFGEQDLPHVFDRFYRAPGARRLPGSGLGLAIVRQAAEAHRGQAEAANAPDGGAVVRVGFGPLLTDGVPEVSGSSQKQPSRAAP